MFSFVLINWLYEDKIERCNFFLYMLAFQKLEKNPTKNHKCINGQILKKSKTQGTYFQNRKGLQNSEFNYKSYLATPKYFNE